MIGDLPHATNADFGLACVQRHEAARSATW